MYLCIANSRQMNSGNKRGPKKENGPRKRSTTSSSQDRNSPKKRSGSSYSEDKPSPRKKSSSSYSEDRPGPKKRSSSAFSDDKGGPKKRSTTSAPYDKRGGSKKPFFKNKRKPEDLAPKDASVRLNRYLANAGICSRREADVIIQSGSVRINNEVVTELGTKVQPGDTVHYAGEKISGEAKRYVLLNKPKDYITTMDDPQKRRTVMDLVGRACKERIYPVGRLDRATSGLLLFTNDGHLARQLTHPSSKVNKTYQVQLDKKVTKTHLIQLVEGVRLEDGVANADKAFYQNDGEDKSKIVVDLHSGKNRVIRRMMESLGYKVMRLDRTIFAGLTKKNLPRGRFRHLEESEIGLLHRIGGLK